MISKGETLVAVNSKNLGRHPDSIYHEEYMKKTKNSKRPMTAWIKLVKNITTDQKCGVKEAIKYIKENNLYK